MKLAKYIVLILIVLSCKKDKLKNEKEILVGTWIWDYSIISNVACTKDDKHIKTNDVYEIVFKEKGKVEFYKNSTRVDRGRILFTQFIEEINTSYYRFGIDVNNNSEEDLDGYVIENALVIVRNFPFKDETCMDYTSYFIRK
jgi:hypothetical protein